jgi:apolipoprotein N-acyltransferase
MIQISTSKRYLLSLLTGILLGIAFPFTGSLTFLGFVAWVPLLLVERQLHSMNRNALHIFPHAFIAFTVYNTISTWWIYNASGGGAIFAFLLNALLMALVIVAFHFTKKILGDQKGYMGLIFYWIGFEYIHYYWELSWPWLNLGNIFSIHPSLVQWYDFSGVLGGTLWLLLVNLIVLKLVVNVKFLKENWAIQTPVIITLATAIVLPISISLCMYFSYSEIKKPIEVVITQPNIDPYTEKFSGPIQDQLNSIFGIADTLVTKKTDFVLAPETALPFEFFEEDVKNMIYYKFLLEAKAKWGKPSLLIGASTKRFFHKRNSNASRKVVDGASYGYEESYNSSMLIDRLDHHRFVHKSKLVLGVEKIPFAGIFPWLENLAIENGGTSGTLGIESKPPVMRAEGHSFAPIVCYESIYGEFISQQVKRGADVLFVITNDGWWGESPGYKQHMSFSRLRAVENRRSLARSANTGISCIINQRGDVVQATVYGVKTGLRGTLNLNHSKTFYSTYGDIIGRILGALGSLFFVFSIGQKFRFKLRKA